MELRLTIARLLFEFDFREVATPGKGVLWQEGFAAAQGEFRLMDHFTSRKEGPVVVFEGRSG
jgi:hypothetical protein